METRIRTINLLRKAVEPPAGVETDFEILVEFSKRLGLKDKDGNPLVNYASPEEAFEEWKKISEGRPSDMTGMTYDRLEKENGIRWPSTRENPQGKVRLYEDGCFLQKQITVRATEKTLSPGVPKQKKNIKR
ncbi:hypothetical protein SAMN05216352_112109 [Alteribacillus bidgolensis]|uniref:Uncharacterized protein n=1 Tax=Alteribacillus bidgolensis TaxID=930129 RepID=A0A1G8NRR1_9BACI|nr:hypothetical protein [Alteribacillus bidgolensis]SDI82190.1 hypothetical protein SAMN05216352_112109 [Alteribacillus bidgolensis]